jgi:hypothetical protein
VKLGSCESFLLRLNFCQEGCQLNTVKLSLKRHWALGGEGFVQGPPELDGFQVGNVIGREHLPLDDREVAFDLVQPTGVDRGMDHLMAAVANIRQTVLRLIG